MTRLYVCSHAARTRARRRTFSIWGTALWRDDITAELNDSHQFDVTLPSVGTGEWPSTLGQRTRWDSASENLARRGKASKKQQQYEPARGGADFLQEGLSSL